MMRQTRPSAPPRSPDDAGRAPGVDELAINTIRTLAIDAVERAKSGHAGAPMGLAPVAYTLWRRFLRYDPDHPEWPNRDRFVLSNGHASMLLYALLHLAGVRRLGPDGLPTGRPAVSLDDIKAFRQLDSLTPGHPEYGHTTGVETTTGPLGQGVGDSVGMAIAERWLAARFNRPDFPLFDHDVYAICSDGDLMEGISGEAASLAGHLKLSNLCWIYDHNSVTIEGRTGLAFDEDVARRFEGYGWAIQRVDDANDCEAFARALEAFRATSERPTLIIVTSVIGYGSPHLQGTAKAHSDPLGEDEVRLTKDAYGWPKDAQFLVPDGVRERLQSGIGSRGRILYAAWSELFADYALAHPDAARELRQMHLGQLPDDWARDIPNFPADEKGMATREASGKVLNAIAPRLPWLIGGSADLAPSTKTLQEGGDAGDFEAGQHMGRNLRYGVREHVMGAVSNGLSLSRLRPYTGTFLVFSDYMRPPIRLAALMRQPVVFIFSHDSIGLGQDGPTHQPVEQLAGLRAIPNLVVLRPCDANETAEAWRLVVERADGPSCLILSRQPLPTLDRSCFGPAVGVRRGGYVLAGDPDEEPEVILIGTGGEVRWCVDAWRRLTGEGVRARVVSLPSFELFEAQDEAYREAVLPPAVTARVTIEAASPMGWDRYAGPTGAIIAMRGFGASAPIEPLMERFGFTADHVYKAAKAQLAAARGPTSAR